MDGTLTRTNQLIFDTFNHVSDIYLNRRYSPEEITAMFGPPENIAIQRLVDAADTEHAMRDFYNYYTEHHETKADLYDGIREVLEKLRSADIMLALFTGKGRLSTEITLEKFGLHEYFPVVVSGNDVIKHKPAGEGIRRALDKMNLTETDAIMIGDSVADVKASREAGIDIALALWDSYSYERVIQYETRYRFYTIAELNRWIDKLIKITINESKT